MKASLFIAFVVATLVVLCAQVSFAMHQDAPESFIGFRDEPINIPIDFPEYDTPAEYMEVFFNGSPRENAAFLAAIVSAAKQHNAQFGRHREGRVQLEFGLPLIAFDARYDIARIKLMALADELHLSYNIYTTSYADLLSRCSAIITQRVDLLPVLMECDEEAELFAHAYTLLSHEEESAALRSIIYLDKPITWALNKLKSNKCSYCKKLFGYVKSKACDKAGDYVCTLIINAVTEGVLAPFSGKICGSPLNLASYLSKACTKLVNYVGSKTMTAEQACGKISFGTLSIPAHHGAILDYSAHSLTIGSLC